MGSNELSPEIVSLLEKAVNDDIDNYNVVIHDENAAGQGYLGELVRQNTYIHSQFVCLLFVKSPVLWYRQFCK